MEGDSDSGLENELVSLLTVTEADGNGRQVTRAMEQFLDR